VVLERFACRVSSCSAPTRTPARPVRSAAWRSLRRHRDVQRLVHARCPAARAGDAARRGDRQPSADATAKDVMLLLPPTRSCGRVARSAW
jgi:hypothetical protein